MNRLGGFLALFLGSLLCVSAVFARGSLATWPHANNPILAAQAEACTLDVVLVTFRDATGSTTDPAHEDSYNYENRDRPWGEVGRGNNRQLTARSYRRHDFLRLLAGGYNVGGHPTPFVGNTVTVANGNEVLPEVFGSVRAYFDQMSNGAFQLHVRMVNPPPAGRGDFPRWIELPETKEHYAELIDNLRNQNVFWNAAYRATMDSLALPDPAWQEVGISLPDRADPAYPFSRLVRRKILFLYSGAVFTPDLDTTAVFQNGLLHPQVDVVTRTQRITGLPTLVGYRYVMGERQGWSNNDDDIDRFAGIGMHAHEIGHLLGLTHGWGYWVDRPNRYSGAAQYTNAQGANQLGWTLMQGGGDQGPRLEDGGYYVGYRSCPNPINPFYLRDLGWLTPDEILGPQNGYAIAAGTTHWIERNTTTGGPVEFLLNRRTRQAFGGRYVLFYDYATRNDAEQGLMIWRRYSEHHPNWEERPMLIVADARRYRNARDSERDPDIDEYYDMLSDPFAAGRIEAPDGYDPFDQDNVSAVHSLDARAGLRQETEGEEHPITGIRNGRGYHPDPGEVNLALTNIEYDGDNILVDVTFAPPTAPALTAHVQERQVTLRWAASDDPTVSYQYWYDGVSTPMDLDPPYADPIEVPITGLTDDTYTFEVTAVNGLGTATATLTATPQALGESAVDFAEDVTPDVDDTPAVASYTGDRLG